MALGTGVLFVAAIITALVLAAMGRKPLPATLANGLESLAPGERNALQKVCSEAGLTPQELTLIRVWPLEISKQPRAIVIEGARVRALRISGTSLADARAVAGLPSLEALWLDRNKLTAIESLGKLNELRELNLRGNSLASLNDLPKALRVLDAGDNALAGVDGIVSAIALQRLFIGRNQIRSAAPLAALRVLAEIDLDHNQLTTIDPVLEIKTLRRLYVRGNPLAVPPPLIMRDGFLEIYADR